MPIAIKAVEDEEFTIWLDFAKENFAANKLNSDNFVSK